LQKGPGLGGFATHSFDGKHFGLRSIWCLTSIDIFYYYYSTNVLFIVKVLSTSIEKSVIVQNALSTAKSFCPMSSGCIHSYVQEDQVAALKRKNVAAEFLSSTQKTTLKAEVRRPASVTFCIPSQGNGSACVDRQLALDLWRLLRAYLIEKGGADCCWNIVQSDENKRDLNMMS
jgi:hypothetical protein